MCLYHLHTPDKSNVWLHPTNFSSLGCYLSLGTTSMENLWKNLIIDYFYPETLMMTESYNLIRWGNILVNSSKFCILNSGKNTFRFIKIIDLSIWTIFNTKAIVQKCSVKKMLLKITQKSQENKCARVSFLIKLQAWGFCKCAFLWMRNF